MKPRILLATKVPFYFQKLLKAKEKLPPFQAQSLWIKALRELGCQTKIFVYNKNFLLPRPAFLKINFFLQANFPVFYEKIRLGLNRFYFLNPENYFRSFSFTKVVAQWQPDYLFLTGGISEIFPQALKFAKKKGVKIVLFHGVSPKIGLTRAERRMIPFFDWVIANDRYHALEWQRRGVKKAVGLPYAGIDPEFHQKLEPIKKFSSEVCFLGTLTTDRQRKLIKLHQNLSGIDLKVWGYLPPATGLEKEMEKIYQGEAWGRKMVKVLNSTKIALNFQPKHMRGGGNMRTFEIPACGAFQLTDRIEPSWFKIGKEVVVFKDLEDLGQKIKFYLKNEKERHAIAQAGYWRTHQEHTYQKRFEKLLPELN